MAAPASSPASPVAGSSGGLQAPPRLQIPCAFPGELQGCGVAFRSLLGMSTQHVTYAAPAIPPLVAIDRNAVKHHSPRLSATLKRSTPEELAQSSKSGIALNIGNGVHALACKNCPDKRQAKA